MNPDDLILFQRIAEAGSLSGAAVRCGVPKSTLSRRLAALERALGGKLLLRTAHRFSLTEFGEQILTHAQRLAEETEAVRALAEHRQSVPSGLLRVSLPPDFAELDLGGLAQAYVRAFPQVRLELDLSPRRVDLGAERFDIAVRVAVSLADDVNLIARKLANFERGLFASPGFLEREGSPATPADLPRHTGLRLVDSGGSPQPWSLSRGSERWEGLPSGPLACNSVGLLRDLALRGLGVVGMPRLFVAPYLAAGALVPVLPDWQLPGVTAWCLTPGRLVTARARAFADLLCRSLADRVNAAGQLVSGVTPASVERRLL